MRVKPGSHITITIEPYKKEFTARNKHGATHLLRVIEREALFSLEHSSQESKGGKILNIFEQQIASGEDNAGIARALRRHGEWMRAPRRRKPKDGVQTVVVTCGGQGNEFLDKRGPSYPDDSIYSENA